MAVSHGGLDIGYIAGEDLSSHQFHFVHLENDTQVTLMDNGTEFPIGILQNAPTSGEVAVVRVSGTSYLKMNAAVAVGAKVKHEYVSASDCGKGQSTDVTKEFYRGICIMASGAEDDIGAVLLVYDNIPVVASQSPSLSASMSASRSASSSASASVSPSVSASRSASQSASASVSPSASISPSSSASPSGA
ncbi:MAG: hypothetical protein MUF10_19250 [Thermoanaerobaculaceae bacterium]|jgi:hypothetical protein|nr:hypothetical protein [Thermoanaerobaculaceae bacterium]